MKIAFTKIFLMSKIPFKIAWMDLVWWLLGSRATMIYISKFGKSIDSFKDMLHSTFLPLASCIFFESLLNLFKNNRINKKFTLRKILNCCFQLTRTWMVLCHQTTGNQHQNGHTSQFLSSYCCSIIQNKEICRNAASGDSNDLSNEFFFTYLSLCLLKMLKGIKT